MGVQFEVIRSRLRDCRLDESLLFLGHLLSVRRGTSEDPELLGSLARLRFDPTHIVHLVAKWLVLESSNFGRRPLDWSMYERIQGSIIAVDDPIVHEPGWEDGEPTGFLERAFAQQLSPQIHEPLQSIGLALRLFRDAARPRGSGDYDLHTAVTTLLGETVEDYLAMGLLAAEASQASIRSSAVPGTLDYDHLTHAYVDGAVWCVPETWEPFLSRVAGTRDEIRALMDDGQGYRVVDDRFVISEFNPLRQRPLIHVEPGRFIAPDPRLILAKTTKGLFYDLFDAHRHDGKFTGRFGVAFERLVGDLLAESCPADRLWSDENWQRSWSEAMRADPPKRGDWAYRGDSRTVLFECKSMRPTLNLLHYGRQEDVEVLRGRVVKGLIQAATQGRAIRQGEYSGAGLIPAPTINVLVSYGKYFSVGLPSFRDRVRAKLAEQGFGEEPFAVLSIEELDRAIQLADLGEPLDDVLLTISESENCTILPPAYAAKLEGSPIASRATRESFEAFAGRFFR